MGNELEQKWTALGGNAPEHWDYATVESLLSSPKSIAVGVMYPGNNTEGGIPLVKVSDVKNGRVITKPDFLISTAKDEEYKRTRLAGNELLITLVGNPGDCVYVTPEMRNWNVARAIAVLRLKDPGLRRWIRHVLLSPPAQHFIDSRLNTTVQKTLNLKDIRELVIPIPPESERHEITLAIGTLDEKIELNRQMNTTLEAMAQALFKSWFVDFDPVIDNALAAGNPIPDELAERAERRAKAAQQPSPEHPRTLPAAIRQQFPDRFVFTETMGWVPEGWEATQFGALAQIVMGQSPKGDTYNDVGTGLPLINGPVEFGYFFAQKMKWTTSPTKLSAKGDLIVCVRGSTTGRYVKSDEEYCLGRGVCAIRAKLSQGFVDQTYYHHREALLQMATGSTFPNWSGPTLNSFVVLRPSSEIVSLFDRLTTAWTGKLETNVKQIIALTGLRDTLLPKLLSGQLRIPEAEQLVAEVI
tara:strand:- start:4734 stop:6143 length:1410 start_codon:yes stop_codon:yes gene_type:complete